MTSIKLSNESSIPSHHSNAGAAIQHLPYLSFYS